jgi:hypothetical protein
MCASKLTTPITPMYRVIIEYLPQNVEFLLKLRKLSGVKGRDKREFLFMG